MGGSESTLGKQSGHPGRPSTEDLKIRTHVADCSVTNCSFNDHTNCNAAAITVSGGEDHAHCATFIETGSHGGLPKVLGDVAACQRAECAHNDRLMCQAPEVHVGPGKDSADCLPTPTASRGNSTCPAKPGASGYR